MVNISIDGPSNTELLAFWQPIHVPVGACFGRFETCHHTTTYTSWKCGKVIIITPPARTEGERSNKPTGSA
jgi:hypothetical protein